MCWGTWAPSSRLSSWAPPRSPSRMACRRCRFSMSQRLPSSTSGWVLRLGSFMIQKATRRGSGCKPSMAFCTGTRVSFSSTLGTWEWGTGRSWSNVTQHLQDAGTPQPTSQLTWCFGVKKPFLGWQFCFLSGLLHSLCSKFAFIIYFLKDYYFYVHLCFALCMSVWEYQIPWWAAMKVLGNEPGSYRRTASALNLAISPAHKFVFKLPPLP